MRPSVITRLEKLEAASGDACGFVVAIAGRDETCEQAIERATAGLVVDGRTHIVCVNLLATTRDEYLRRHG